MRIKNIGDPTFRIENAHFFRMRKNSIMANNGRIEERRKGVIIDGFIYWDDGTVEKA